MNPRHPVPFILSSILGFTLLLTACTGNVDARCEDAADPACQDGSPSDKPLPGTPPGHGDDTGPDEEPPDTTEPGVEPPPEVTDPGDPPIGGEPPEAPSPPSAPPGSNAGVGRPFDPDDYTRLWYVSTSGNDSASDAGTEARPLRTIARAISLVRPGEAVIIREGVYPERLRIEERDGTADAPITVRAAPGETVVLRGRSGGDSASRNVIDVRRAHWHFDGLTLDLNGDPAFAILWREGGNHGVLRNSVAKNGTAGAGVNVAHGASNILIENNRIHNFSKPSDDSHGVFVQPRSSRVIVRRNVIHDNSGDAVQCIGSEGGAAESGTPFDDLLIEDNVLHDNLENGVDIKTCTRIVIRGNDLYGHLPKSTSKGEAIVVHMSASDVRVEENRFWNNGRAISIGGVTSGADPSNVVVRRNVMWSGNATNGGEAGGIRLANVNGVVVFHNTIHDMSGYCISYGSSGTSRDVTIVNNISSNCGLSVRAGTTTDRVFVDNNLYFNSGGALTFRLGNSQVNFDRWRNDGGHDRESLQADPRFVDARAQDFRLAAGSPALDRGTDVAEGFCGALPDLGALESCPR
ncbi:MAG TPA: right-handed parallel beta-helix repeat-containing protein [Myxococcaceae bacterium]|nr:right-handed parallel beta-helix repeat-containing protein [Myxococcaceae bacterium]